MLNVTPVEAVKGARMSKLDELDRFIAALEKRRAELNERIETLRGALENSKNALNSIEDIYARTVELRDTIPPDMLHVLDDAPLGRMASDLEALGTQTKNEALPPAEIIPHVREALLAAGRPMKRGELVKALSARSIQLAGKDKNKNLGTILWRHPDQFVSLDRLGYWVKGVPLPGVYEPSDEGG
jgi:hypothetical protein